SGSATSLPASANPEIPSRISKPHERVSCHPDRPRITPYGTQDRAHNNTPSRSFTDEVLPRRLLRVGLVGIVERESELFELRLIELQDLVDRFLVVVLVDVGVDEVPQAVAGGLRVLARQLVPFLRARFVSTAGHRAMRRVRGTPSACLGAGRHREHSPPGRTRRAFAA